MKSTQRIQISAVSGPKPDKKGVALIGVKVEGGWLNCYVAALFPKLKKGFDGEVVIDEFNGFKKIVDIVPDQRGTAVNIEPTYDDQPRQPYPDRKPVIPNDKSELKAQLDRIEKTLNIIKDNFLPPLE